MLPAQQALVQLLIHYSFIACKCELARIRPHLAITRRQSLNQTGQYPNDWSNLVSASSKSSHYILISHSQQQAHQYSSTVGPACQHPITVVINTSDQYYKLAVPKRVKLLMNLYEWILQQVT